MTFKSSFESHPVVFGFSLIVIGFGVGFAFRGYLPSQIAIAVPVATCNIQGADVLSQGHNARLAELQKSIENLEAQASDQGNITAYQDRYRASADRVRKDIAQEIDGFKASVASLTNKCKA